MNALRIGYVAGPIIGALWTLTMAIVTCMIVSFATGAGIAPAVLPSLIFGAWLGFVWLPDGARSRGTRIATSAALAIAPALAFLVLSPALIPTDDAGFATIVVAWILFAVASALLVGMSNSSFGTLGVVYGGSIELETAVIAIMMSRQSKKNIVNADSTLSRARMRGH